MLFNSVEFGVFLVSVFFLYWFVFQKNLQAQNLFLLAVSYLFYGWWDWRFLGLIAFSSLVDFIVGLGFNQTNNTVKRKMLLALSLVSNLGLLGFFKYYNFFIESFVESFSFTGFNLHASTLSIILPVGISFYTFQTLSYTIDTYRGNIKPCKNWIQFFAFVSFFPQLVAGPIERASRLLPQFKSIRKFDQAQATAGLRLILWGLFKKVVIADNCALFVNEIFADYQNYNAITLVIAAVLFAFQIYGDFSGYSDIAIGTGRLFGFDLMRNFNYPYFSRDIAEFWRRWHISLSTWFRDYVYIPLGGSKGSKFNQLRNVMVIFVVSGFWHGANWTFIVWGFLNALYFLPLLLTKRNRRHLNIAAEGKLLARPKELIAIGTTFLLTCLAWIFFRSESVVDAFGYLNRIFVLADGEMLSPRYYIVLILGFFVGLEWINRNKEMPLFTFKYRSINLLQYWAFAVIILVFGRFGENQFIYFQF